MKSHWHIEFDYDYAQIQVDGIAIEGNHTKSTSQYNSAVNLITGNSADISGAETPDNWVDLTFDLSSYSGQLITVTAVYITDTYENEYGMAIDDIEIIADGDQIFSDGAENDGVATLDGFLRITDTKPNSSSRYIIELRSFSGVDSSLEADYYEPGILVWLENTSISNNQVSNHPGEGFIGVIDADQTMIADYGSYLQIRDAAFSLFEQSDLFDGVDTQLNSISLFDDSFDYSATNQPESGMTLQTLGIQMEVTSQEQDSSTASLRLLRLIDGENIALWADPTASMDFEIVTFSASVNGGDGEYSYEWSFGDDSDISELESPTHTYLASGTYTVELIVTDGNGEQFTVEKQVDVEMSDLTLELTYTKDELKLDFIGSVVSSSRDIALTTWNLGDGTIVETPEGNHVYEQSGQYTLIYTVTDVKGRVQQESIDIEVYPLPIAEFSTVANYLAVTFSNESRLGKGNLSYEWTFGDGNTSTEIEPTHQYQIPGKFEVKLTVTDEDGQTSEVKRDIAVFSELVSSFDSSVVELVVQFTNTSTGGSGALNYNWNFGDGTSNTEISPSHSYASSGTYTVTLTVTDSISNSEVSTSQISVQAAAAIVEKESDGGSGGGSLSFISLVLMIMMGRVKRKV